MRESNLIYIYTAKNIETPQMLNCDCYTFLCSSLLSQCLQLPTLNIDYGNNRNLFLMGEKDPVPT